MKYIACCLIHFEEKQILSQRNKHSRMTHIQEDEDLGQRNKSSCMTYIQKIQN